VTSLPKRGRCYSAIIPFLFNARHIAIRPTTTIIACIVEIIIDDIYNQVN